MIHSYDELYVAKAQTALAQMLLYGVEDLQIDLTEFPMLYTRLSRQS